MPARWSSPASRCRTSTRPRRARLGIAAIYQQPSLFPHLTVAENIALALESGGPWRRLDWTRRRARAAELLERIGASIDPDRLVETLSMPEQQIVEIAKAIGADARIVIMDEPTASLTEREVERLFAVIARLRSDGVGVIYISHRLEEIFTVADRITVLRDGETVATARRAEVDRAELIRLMVGRELVRRVPEAGSRSATSRSRCAASRTAQRDRRRLAVGAARRDSRPRRAGRLRTHAAGGDPVRPVAGRLRRDPGPRRAPCESRRRRRRFAPASATCPEDRRQHGVVLEMSIAANASLASLGAVSTRGLIDRGLERRAPRTTSISSASRRRRSDADVGTLSGGNQQKVALARWLSIGPVGPHPRRADAGRRRRIEGGDSRPDAGPGRARARDRHDLVGAARRFSG